MGLKRSLWLLFFIIRVIHVRQIKVTHVWIILSLYLCLGLTMCLRQLRICVNLSNASWLVGYRGSLGLYSRCRWLFLVIWPYHTLLLIKELVTIISSLYWFRFLDCSHVTLEFLGLWLWRLLLILLLLFVCCKISLQSLLHDIPLYRLWVFNTSRNVIVCEGLLCELIVGSSNIFIDFL